VSAASDKQPPEELAPLDPSLVAALYVEHGEELRRFLLGVLRDGQLVSDVLQATFAKLVQQGHQTREPSRKAWLFRVAYHEALACRRREGASERALQQVAWHQNGTASPGTVEPADEPLLRLEAVEAVRRALDALPAEQRQVVRMRIYDEQTFAAIAKELNIPLGTALGRMRAALVKLRAALGDERSHERPRSASDKQGSFGERGSSGEQGF
jgi:RNA polymerase sigma-70 factor, ECF subfamily